MKVSRGKDGIVWTYSKHDVFKRQFILMSSKLVDEAANNWFRSYLMRYYKNVDISSTASRNKDVQKKLDTIRGKTAALLSEKYGFGDRDFDVYIMSFSSVECEPDKSKFSYELSNKNGEKLKFNNYNGYWYECEEHPEYIFFDYGDFYCMGNVFPLATFCVILANQWRRDNT